VALAGEPILTLSARVKALGAPVILVDSSAWIEYLRNTDHPVSATLHGLLTRGADVRITEPIMMELLAGADTPAREAAISRLTNGLNLIPVDPAVDYRAAAAIFVAAGRIGKRIRSLNDCLIAAVAIRSEAELLHKDRDFEEIAKVVALSQH
jgi:predicted nucleic acid-binding protein